MPLKGMEGRDEDNPVIDYMYHHIQRRCRNATQSSSCNCTLLLTLFDTNHVNCWGFEQFQIGSFGSTRQSSSVAVL